MTIGRHIAACLAFRDIRHGFWRALYEIALTDHPARPKPPPYAPAVQLRRVDARLTEVEVDGEVAVYHPGTDRVVLLNSAATEIWRRTPITSLDDLSAEVAEHFGVDVVQVREGVVAGIDLLVAEQLLVEADPEPRVPDDSPGTTP